MKELLLGVLFILIVGIGGLVYRNAVEHPSRPIACPLEAKMCPDGTAVGRTGPSCTFPVCPPPNVSLDEVGVGFAIPEGFAAASAFDASSVATYQMRGTASSSAGWIIVRRYPLDASSTALSVIQKTALGGASGLPVSVTAYSSPLLGERRLSDLLTWAEKKKTKAKGKLAYFVELKVDGDESRRDALVNAIVKELKDHKALDRSVLISFDEPVLMAVKRLHPTVSTGFLYSDLLYDVMERAKRLKVNHVLPRKDRVTGDLVNEAHAEGMAVMAWTADRLDEFRKLVVWGVDAIATNYPDRLIEFYQR
jgi:hypothetical protein